VADVSLCFEGEAAEVLALCAGQKFDAAPESVIMSAEWDSGTAAIGMTQ
jgi:hypothetical protein